MTTEAPWKISQWVWGVILVLCVATACIILAVNARLTSHKHLPDTRSYDGQFDLYTLPKDRQYVWQQGDLRLRVVAVGRDREEDKGGDRLIISTELSSQRGLAGAEVAAVVADQNGHRMQCVSEVWHDSKDGRVRKSTWQFELPRGGVRALSEFGLDLSWRGAARRHEFGPYSVKAWNQTIRLGGKFVALHLADWALPPQEGQRIWGPGDGLEPAVSCLMLSDANAFAGVRIELKGADGKKTILESFYKSSVPASLGPTVPTQFPKKLEDRFTRSWTRLIDGQQSEGRWVTYYCLSGPKGFLQDFHPVAMTVRMTEEGAVYKTLHAKVKDIPLPKEIW